MDNDTVQVELSEPMDSEFSKIVSIGNAINSRDAISKLIAQMITEHFPEKVV